MGTDVHLIVGGAGAGDLVERAERRISDLERRWSRFRPDSEVSRLNAGDPMTISDETFELVDRAVTGWRMTGGAFDPTVLDAVTSLGYDRDFGSLGGSVAGSRPSRPARGCNGTVLSRAARLVKLPDGARIDPGGIGKGLAADMVSSETMRAGARGCCVDIGGDLRVAGSAPGAGAWGVDVEDPLAGRGTIGCIRLRRGAATTSWRTKRTWAAADGERHHLVDPSTGESIRSGVASVTAVTGLAWKGEVLCKAAFVAGPAEGVALLERNGAAGLLVDDGGRVHRAGPIEDFLS